MWFNQTFAHFWLLTNFRLTFVPLKAHNSASTTLSAMHHAVPDAQEYVENEYTWCKMSIFIDH